MVHDSFHIVRRVSLGPEITQSPRERFFVRSGIYSIRVQDSVVKEVSCHLDGWSITGDVENSLFCFSIRWIQIA
jgi:hypothetical protein